MFSGSDPKDSDSDIQWTRVQHCLQKLLSGLAKFSEDFMSKVEKAYQATGINKYYNHGIQFDTITEERETPWQLTSW